MFFLGGGAQTRTGDRGFADLGLTTWLHRLKVLTAKWKQLLSAVVGYCSLFGFLGKGAVLCMPAPWIVGVSCILG